MLDLHLWTFPQLGKGKWHLSRKVHQHEKCEISDFDARGADAEDPFKIFF